LREARRRLEETKTLFWLAECEVPIYHEVFDLELYLTDAQNRGFVKGKISLADLKMH
jgi:hypothetical protein